MAVIAVAGGTGDLGQAVVEELIRVGNHKVVVLSRKPSGPRTGTSNPVHVHIDYDNVDKVALVLEDYQVHTIVSALAINSLGEESQLSLISAAERSSATRRFIPSEYTGHVDGFSTRDPTEADPIAAPILRARAALARTSLETTYFGNGVFMDYFGHPNISSTLRPFKWAINFPSHRAAIPGTGNETITLTYSKDVARFMARLVDDKDWPKFSRVSGSDTCFNEILALVESVTDHKFHVSYDSFEDIEGGKVTSVFDNGFLYAGMNPTELAIVMGMTLMSGEMAVPKEDRLNNRYADIKPIGIEEMIKAAWSRK